MPNWVRNRIVVPADQWDDFKQKYFDDAGELTFEKVITPPPLVALCKEVCHSIGGHDEKCAKIFWDKQPIPDMDFYRSGDEIEGYMRGVINEKCKEVHGVDSMDWNRNNFGVKWDASDIDVYDEECQVDFQTPWGHPTPIFERMVKDGFNIVACWAEEGGDYNGEGEVVDGQWEEGVADKSTFMDLWGYDPDECYECKSDPCTCYDDEESEDEE